MKKEKKALPYYGIHAVLKIFENRKEAIERIYCTEEKTAALRVLLKWCASQKKPYHIVEEKDLEKLTESTHHEGVCCMALPPPSPEIAEFTAKLEKKSSALVVFLNEVDNPHNLGAILRTLSHFGVSSVIVDHPIRLSPSCCRIAQGGCEYVELIYTKEPLPLLQKLKKMGFTLYGTSSHKGSSLSTLKFAPKSLLVMGSESHGIAPLIEKQLSHFITIDGSGSVESLNVSNATALCCYEYASQMGNKS